MTTLNLPTGIAVTFHDSNHKLPEFRRVEAECYQLIESGIGSSMDDIDRHFEPLMLLAQANEPENLLREVNNLRYLFFNILHKQTSARALSLMCRVATVNGKPWDDWTEDGLTRLVEMLAKAGLTDEMVAETLSDVKKN